MARNVELEDAILRAPDDFKNYVVYSDWLLEQGDPRGELITLQRLRKQREAEALLKQHHHHFYGSLADYDDMITGVKWHMGFIQSCRFANNFERRDDPGDMVVRDVLEELLTHPSLVFLRELTVGILDFEGNDYSMLFELLARNPKPALRTLFVGDFHSEETELNWSHIGATGPLWNRDKPGAPNLEQLTLRSGSMNLEGIHAPSLRELVIITGGFDQRSLAAICSAEWPRLETLSLQLGRQARFEIRDFDAIFQGDRFPALRYLGLGNSTISEALAGAIVRSRIVKQLTTVDLSLGTMGDDGAHVLAAGKAALAHLEQLDVSENYISAAGCAALKGVCKNVVDAGQRDDRGHPEHRYIAAYE